jgi:hypothetical protein
MKEEDIWTDQEFAIKCIRICKVHRAKIGYNMPPVEMSCRYDECKEECPLAPE